MIGAAICLLMATVLLASAIQLASTGRRQVRQEQLRMQANWLAEAGLERAAARLDAEAGYRGETWEIAADDLDGQHAGKVLIRIGPAEDAEEMRIVIVEASYPAGATPSRSEERRVGKEWRSRWSPYQS